MKILYVTPLWSGFEDLLFRGCSKARGMPAFIKPLKKLLELGHIIDFVIACPVSKQGDLNINVEWLKNSKIYFVAWNRKGLNGLFSCINLFRSINNLININDYDFVYGHGSIGVVGCIVANRHGISCGQRLYGTFLADEVSKKTRYYIALKYPLEYLSFTTPKKFLIITNDGTRGDFVKKKLVKNNPYTFYYLLNGVDIQDKNEVVLIDEINEIKKPFLFYPARIDKWKRQHLAVDILRHVHEAGKKDVHLYFAGHISDQAYWIYLQEVINKYKLAEYVKYLGVLNENNLSWCYTNCLAVLSLYDVANLGNVVIEALSAGSIVVAPKDGSVDNIIEDNYNGFLINTPENGAQHICELLDDPKKVIAMRKRALARAKEIFISWEERSMKEVDIICSAVEHNER